MVHVDGRVTTCCLDEGLENTLGNARETPLAELWNGSLLHRWRVAQADGRFEDSGPYCTRCNWRGAGTMPAEAVAEYLAGTKEHAALRRFRTRYPHVARHSHRKAK
ncbi:MAG: SPASM domain-containing protein [Deltaproteobacteria bacterium]|nr:SPASM domain-containing protein [Deltaproteobacteria bacterium]